MESLFFIISPYFHDMYRYLLLLLLFFAALNSSRAQEPIDSAYQSRLNKLTSARESNNFIDLATAYYDLGIYEEEKRRNLDKSFQNLSRSLEYYKLTTDTAQTQNCYFHIARQLKENGLLQEAFTKFEELREYYKQRNEPQELARIDLQLFDIYFEKLEVTKAKQVLDEASSHIEKQNNNELVQLFLTKKISYHNILQERDSALYYANICIRDNSNKITKSLNQCLLERANILLSQGKPLQAITDYHKCIENLIAIPYSDTRLVAYKNLSVAYNEIAVPELAYYFSQNYAELQDSILQERRVIAVNNLTYKYETLEKSTEIKMLERDKAFVEKNNDQQRRALLVLGLALGALLIGTYFIVVFYSDKIKNSQIIKTQNEKINHQRIQELEDRIQINSMQSMISGQEIERERIAKDLHDSLGGLLSTVKLQLDNIRTKENNLETLPAYRQATQLLDTAVSEVRSISQNLQPAALSRLGLIPSLNDLVNRYKSDAGPDIVFQHFGMPSKLEQPIAMAIYRIVQEILNNAVKHARAKEILVQLNGEGDEIIVHIEDDGIGFNTEKKYKSMGLENIKSRINYLRGTLEIDSRINEGTSYLIHLNILPIKK